MQVMGAWKFVRSPPAPPLFLPVLARAPYYLRLLSNTKNQIKYAKLRFEDFGESKLPKGRRNIFFTPSAFPPARGNVDTRLDCSLASFLRRLLTSNRLYQWDVAAKVSSRFIVTSSLPRRSRKEIRFSDLIASIARHACAPFDELIFHSKRYIRYIRYNGLYIYLCSRDIEFSREKSSFRFTHREETSQVHRIRTPFANGVSKVSEKHRTFD